MELEINHGGLGTMTAHMTFLLGIPSLTTHVREQDLVLFTHDDQYSQIVPNGKAVITECARIALEHDIQLLPVLFKDDIEKQVKTIRIIESICKQNGIELPTLAFTVDNNLEQDLPWNTLFAIPLALASPKIWQSQETLQAAALLGLESIVSEILEYPCNKKSYQLHSELLEMAVTKNNINKVEHLLTNSILHRHHEFYQEIAFNSAVKAGHVNLAKQLVFKDLTGHRLEVVMNGLTATFKNGNTALANILRQTPEIRQKIPEYADKLLLAVCEGGHVVALDALIAMPEFTLDISANNNEALQIACKTAKVKLVKKLLTYPKVAANIACQSNRALINACESGNVKLVKMLLNYPEVKKLVTTIDNSALKAACVSGHLAVVQELLTIPEVMSTIGSWQSDIVQIACLSGNVDLVKTLFAIPKVKESATAENIVFCELYENEHVDIVQYLLTQIEVNDELLIDVLHRACKFDQLKMVSALLSIEKIKNAFIKNPETIFTEACHNNHLGVVKKLLKIIGSNNTVFNIQAMRVACSNNDITFLRELLLLPGVIEKAADLDNSALREACLVGNLEIAEELLKIPEVHNSINAKGNAVLIATCKSGNVILLRKLLAIPAVKAVVADNRNQAFREACFVGNTEIVAELLTIEAVRKNATINQNHAMWRACLTGNMDVVRLLLTVPDIRSELKDPNSIILTSVAESGNIDILCEILDQPEMLMLSGRQFNQALKGAIREQALQSVNELLYYPQVLATLADNDNAVLVAAIEIKNSEIILRLLKEKSVCKSLTFSHLIALLEISEIGFPEFNWSAIIAKKCFSKMELLELLDLVSDSNQQGLEAFAQYLLFYGYEAIAPNLSGEDLRNAILLSINKSFKNYFQDPKTHAAMLLHIRAEVAYLNKLSSKSDLAGNLESAMDHNLVHEAVKRFNEKVKADFKEIFTLMGGLGNIESAIYAALLDKKISILKQSQTKETATQLEFIEKNKSTLSARDESVLSIAREYFTSTTDVVDIVLRAFDSKAATHGWEKLFVAPSKEKAKVITFSTRAASDTTLNIKQASDICREMLCYAFLVSQDASLNEKLRSELFDVFVMYIAEISRAHNESSEDTDNPSCFPGTLSRLDLIFQRHPKYHMEISVFNLVNEYASQLIIKAFSNKLDSLANLEEAKALYEAIILFDHTTALTILHPNHTDKLFDTEGETPILENLLKVRFDFFNEYFGKKAERGVQEIKKRLQSNHQISLSSELEVIALLPFMNMGKATPSITYSLTEAYQRTCLKVMTNQMRINPFKSDYEKTSKLYGMLPESRREKFIRMHITDANLKAVYFEKVNDINSFEVEENYLRFKAKIADENPNLSPTEWKFYELLIELLSQYLQCDRTLFPSEENIIQIIATAKEKASQKISVNSQKSNLSFTPQYEQVRKNDVMTTDVDSKMLPEREERQQVNKQLNAQ